jgi:KDO2-lipid IV(A) lauroyltransferase
LESNLAKVSPGIGRKAFRKLSRQAMRRYLRYFREALTLPRWPPERIDASVRLEGAESFLALEGEDRQGVLAMGHLGNWDLAGAWAARNLADVITVAEHLEPEAVFQDFLRLRRELGITVIPLEKDGSTFRALLRESQRPGAKIMPLLADRDLSRGGVEVTLAGHKALVAAGPAALALATGRPLYPVAMWAEGRGYVIRFYPAVAPDPSLDREGQVRQMTQGWVDGIGHAIAEHPADWHMLQAVFTADLDPERLARRRAA